MRCFWRTFVATRESWQTLEPFFTFAIFHHRSPSLPLSPSFTFFRCRLPCFAVVRRCSLSFAVNRRGSLSLAIVHERGRIFFFFGCLRMSPSQSCCFRKTSTVVRNDSEQGRTMANDGERWRTTATDGERGQMRTNGGDQWRKIANDGE